MRLAKSITAAIALVVSAVPGIAEAQYWRGPPVYVRAMPPGYYARSGYPGRDYPPPPPPYGYRGGPPPGPYGYRGPPPQRYRCHRGGSGAIIGAIAGGLLGNAVAGRGDRGIGTIFGAGAGALTGREIGRGC